jgi:hypothetical protein
MTKTEPTRATTKITIEISEELKAKLIEVLKEKGIPMNAYFKSVITKEVGGKSQIDEEGDKPKPRVYSTKDSGDAPKKAVKVFKPRTPRQDIPRERAAANRAYKAEKYAGVGAKKFKTAEKESEAEEGNSFRPGLKKGKTDPKKSRFASKSRTMRTAVKSGKKGATFGGKKKFSR